MPPGWSSSGAFSAAESISFGSINLCQNGEQPSCARTSRGHRKYALRARIEGVEGATNRGELRPPAFIHGDPAEKMMSTKSGVFVAHFSRCDTGFFKKKYGSSWLDSLLEEKKIHQAALSELENEATSEVECSFGDKKWTYY